MDRREYNRQWCAANKERRAKRAAEYAAAHADEIREYQRKYHQEHAESLRAAGVEYRNRTREATSARNKAKYLADPEKFKQKATTRYEKKRPEIRAQAKEYYRRNEAAFKRRAAERRARIEQVTVGNPAEIERFYEAVAAAKSIRCYWCKKNVKRADRHVDHIIPLAGGGAHATANLCCACKTCNLKKHTKSPEKFSGQGELSLA